MNKKQRRRMMWLAGLVIVVLLFWWARPAPYPDVINPKPVKGNPDASIIIEEFSDLQCPACAAAHPVVKRLIEEYGDVIQLRYKHFPLDSIHPQASLAAEASECANDQGAFWDYVDILFVSQDRLSAGDLRSYAAELDLDVKSFKACLASGKKAKIVTGEQREGLARRVQGTPTFFINGEQVRSWGYDAFAAEIEARLPQDAS